MDSRKHITGPCHETYVPCSRAAHRRPTHMHAQPPGRAADPAATSCNLRSRNPLQQVYYARADTRNSRTFWKRRSQGPGPSGAIPASAGAQGCCQPRKQRSGCGMMARCRPHGDVSAAMPAGEPLGLAGYASVAAPPASQYLTPPREALLVRFGVRFSRGPTLTRTQARQAPASLRPTLHAAPARCSRAQRPQVVPGPGAAGKTARSRAEGVLRCSARPEPRPGGT
jgi:hypothetical protein